ncbi:DUF1572 family protein [Niabella yanshanensis]
MFIFIARLNNRTGIYNSYQFRYFSNNRWTNFLAGDGEKVWRNRKAELGE